MAIMKATYTKSAASAKASVRYIEHRPGKDGQKITRTLFNADGKMQRYEAYRMIDEAGEGSYFFRFVISPDPKLEDTEKDIFLRGVTEKAIYSLEDRLGRAFQWVAAIHADHAPHRHIHVVAIIPKRLNVQDFQLLRNAATKEALMQRQQRDLLYQDRARSRAAHPEQNQGRGLSW